MKIKFNWGTGLLLTIITFMGITAGLVIFSMNRDVDLVTNHYYEKELVYQKQIDTEKRTADQNKEVQINYSGSVVNLFYPGITADDSVEGTVYFYRPSDGKKDFHVSVAPNEDGKQIISSSKISNGFWKVQVSWKHKGEEYYTEKSLLVE